MFHCEAVGLEFLDSAPVLLATNVTVNRPPDEVFAAFAHDPATWGEFFPGFDRSGYYHTPGPHGVGSGYAKRFLGITVEERVLAWDEGKRFASRVERTSLPVFHAWVEDYRFEPDGGNGTQSPQVFRYRCDVGALHRGAIPGPPGLTRVASRRAPGGRREHRPARALQPPAVRRRGRTAAAGARDASPPPTAQS